MSSAGLGPEDTSGLMAGNIYIIYEKCFEAIIRERMIDGW